MEINKLNEINKEKNKTEKIKKQTSVFVKRKRTFTIAFLSIAALFAISVFVTKYNVIRGFESIPKAVTWMAKNFIPDEKAWTRLPNILTKLTETALVSVAVTVCATIALPQ